MEPRLASESVRLERERRRTLKAEHSWEREKLAWSVATNPMVLRLALLALITAYTTYVNTHPKESGTMSNALAVVMPTIGVPLIAADAGVTDWKALVALGAASGGISALTNKDVVDAVTLEAPFTGQPLISLFGPLAGLKWSWEGLQKLSSGEWERNQE